MKKKWIVHLAVVMTVVLLGTACGSGAQPAGTPSQDKAQVPGGQEETPNVGQQEGAQAAEGQSGNTVDDGKPVDVPMAGASVGGVFSLIGEGVSEMVRREYPGSSVTYEPGNNAGSLVRILEEEFAISIGQSAFEIEPALKGEEPYQKAYSNDDFWVVATLVPSMKTHVYARKEFTDKYGIKTLADIKEKKVPVNVSVNQKGNLHVYNISKSILGGYGITEQDITSWGGKVFYEPSQSSTDLMKDRKLDMIITSTFPPDSKVLDVSSSHEIVLIPLDKSVIDQVAADWGVETGIIPKDAYDFLPEDYYTLSAGAYLLAGKKATNDITYKFAKAIYNNFDYYTGLHPTFAEFEEEMLPKSSHYNLHPGAAQFYKEVGLIQ